MLAYKISACEVCIIWRKPTEALKNPSPIAESRTGKPAMVTLKIQATGLDARASRVKLPAQFIICRIGMEYYLLNNNNDNNNDNNNKDNNNNNDDNDNDDNIIMMMMMMIIVTIRMMTMMIIGTTTIMIMIIIITTTLTMTIMKMIMIKTAQTPCQSLYKDRRI